MYFDTQKKQNILIKEITEWIGTPYSHMGMVKGRAADCIHFVAGVFIGIGAISPDLSKYESYTPDWHLHNARELLYENMHKHADFEDIFLGSEIKNGDVLLYKIGLASSHSALFFDGNIYHALVGRKVIVSVFSDINWYSKLTHILRLK